MLENEKKNLQDCLIDAQNSKHFFITIHYHEGTIIQHKFFTRDFFISNLDICLNQIKEFIEKSKKNEETVEETKEVSKYPKNLGINSI